MNFIPTFYPKVKYLIIFARLLSTVCMGEKPWQEALAEAAAAGYKLVEILMIPGFAHFTPDEVAPDTLWAELDKLGLTTIALHMGA